MFWPVRTLELLSSVISGLFYFLNSYAKPKAGAGECEAIIAVIDVMKVQKPKRRSFSSASLGSGDGSASAPLALCDGSMGGSSNSAAPAGVSSAMSGGVRASCMVAVEMMEGSFEELRSLKVDAEAQTWSGIESQDDSGKQL